MTTPARSSPAAERRAAVRRGGAAVPSGSEASISLPCRRGRGLAARMSMLLVLGVPLLLPTAAEALGSPASGASAARAGAREDGAVWSELKPAQQAALEPLHAQWPTLDAGSKRKWLELAARFPKLGAAEQARVQARMAEWARMTPAERGAARLRFQQAKQIAPNERQARWDAYQALTPEEKRRLAARSAAEASTPSDPLRRAPAHGARNPFDGGPVGGAARPMPAAAPLVIGPVVVQAAPGATTTLIDRRPTPPEHQRPGAGRIRVPGDPASHATNARRRPPDSAASAASAASRAASAPVGVASAPAGAAAGSSAAR